MATESVKIDQNRVNIPNIKDCKDLNDADKYGFLIEVNDDFDEDFNFTTPGWLKLSLKEPDGIDLSQETKNYIRNLVIRYETALYSDDFMVPSSKNYFYKYFNRNFYLAEYFHKQRHNGQRLCAFFNDCGTNL